MGNRPADKATERGLQRRFFDNDGLILGPAWYRAWEAKEVVGTCRVYGCDGLMVALRAHNDGLILWYGAECLSCWHDVAIRSDKPVLERSTRHAEMRSGTFARRERYLKAVHDAKKRAVEAA
jgi:hypothetical protein